MRPKIVLGLKVDTLPAVNGDEESDGNFFSSDFDDGPSLKLVANSNLKTNINPTQEKAIVKNKVESFTDASNRITSIVGLYSNYPKSQPEIDQIYLIPETQATTELTKPINLYATGKSNALIMDSDAYDDNILCQIDLIKFTKDKSISLDKYTKCKLDSRVSALLNYLLSDCSDKGISAFHLLNCLEEFIKFPSFAPVCHLYPDFTIKKVIEKLTKTLIQLFPKHPILESVIHSLVGIDPIANQVMEQQKALLSKQDEDEDSDSFFNDLKAIADKKQAPTFQVFIDDTIINQLDSISAVQKIEKVSVNQPPCTLVYLLPDGSDSLGPQPFSTWLLNQRDKTMPMFAQDTTKPKQTSHSYQSQPLFNAQIGDDETPKLKEYDELYLISLFDHLDDLSKILGLLPSTEIASFFPLYYPTLENVNARSMTAIKRGCLYPSLIEAEFNAHTGFVNSNSQQILETVPIFLGMINIEEWEFQTVGPLKTKRKMPADHLDRSSKMIQALALADLEFVLDGRSPLTGKRFAGMIDGEKYKHPATDKLFRSSKLFQLYTQEEFAPYIAFKIAFATALSIADSNPNHSCNLCFEALSIITSILPQLINAESVRHATLFFAEQLERTDRYFHAVLAFDNFFRSNIKDASSASAIAQVCHRNRDLVRAVFHYTEAIKALIEEKSCDQALYLGKTISSIYSDNGLDSNAISLLSYLIKNTYCINSTLRTSLARDLSGINQAGSMRQPRTKTAQFAPPQQKSDTNEFIPDPKSINTVLIGCQAVEFMLSCRMFPQAHSLLDSITDKCGSIMNKMTSFLRSKLFLKQNKFHEFIQNLPQLDTGERRVTGRAISIDSGAAFDSRAALVRMLARAYSERDSFKEGIFWSEVMILTSQRNSLRELGEGYYLRGKNFLLAAHTCLSNQKPINLFLRSSTKMAKVAKYIDDKRVWPIDELVSECLSSLSMARQCFDKVGKIKKSAEVSLLYVDALLRFFFHLPEKQNMQIEIGYMTYLITPTIAANKSLEIPKSIISINKENLLDEVGIVLKSVDRNTSRLMNPVFIIYSQILNCRYNIMMKDFEKAKTYYEFAWANLTKHFANGQIFAPRHLTFSTMQMFRDILTLMCDSLLKFPTEFINSHLVAFDLLSNVLSLIHMNQSNATMETKHPFAPSVDMDNGILELENPKVPDFTDVLKEIGALEMNKENSTLQKKRGYREYFRIINANIRQFETQKITEDELHKRNRNICLQMEKYAESQRHESESFNPVDSSFSVCLRHQQCLKRMIFISRLFNNIAIYIPFTGDVRLVPVCSAENVEQFNIKANGEQILFQASSSIFSTKLLEQTSNFIFIDKKNKNLLPKKVEDYKEDCLRLFGNLLTNQEIFGVKSLNIPDENSLGDESFFRSSQIKGALTTLDPGFPLVFILGFELAALPVEFFFPETFVVRAQSFTRLVLHKVPLTSYPHAYAFRYSENPEQLHNDGIARSVDICRTTLNALGVGLPVIQSIVTSGRRVPMPFPLFSSNKSNQIYSEKFDFCHFVDIPDEKGPNEQIKDASLVIFTLADLVELPDVISNLMYKYPSTFFMFIPGSIIRHAFADMKLIFARQKIRFLYCMSNPDDPDLKIDKKFCKDGFMFVGALQRTLMEKYRVPIALFSPLGHR